MSKFIIYTYQFSPIQHSGANLFGGDRFAAEEIMSRKQDILGEIISDGLLSFDFRNKIYAHRILLDTQGIVVLRLANSRNAVLEREFQKEKIGYAPSCLVIIDNRKDIQTIAIEEDSSAFHDTEQVVRILRSTFNRLLRPFGLSLYIRKAYQESEFWDIVNSHKDRIELVRFHFSYPNLPRVNKTIKEIISATSRSTNSKQSSLGLKAAAGETLELDKSNEELNDLAGYAADSGDQIELKAKGIRGFIKTGCTTVSVDIDDIEATISKNLFQNGVEKLIDIFCAVYRH